MNRKSPSRNPVQFFRPKQTVEISEEEQFDSDLQNAEEQITKTNLQRKYLRQFNIPKQYILLIDDQDLILDPLSSLFELDGHQTLSLNEPLLASNLITHPNAKKIGFSAVLCDLKMPNLSGLDLLNLCKSHLPQTPFFLMSGHMKKFEWEKALLMGVDGFLRKPFTQNDFYGLIEKYTKHISRTKIRAT